MILGSLKGIFGETSLTFAAVDAGQYAVLDRIGLPESILFFFTDLRTRSVAAVTTRYVLTYWGAGNSKAYSALESIF